MNNEKLERENKLCCEPLKIAKITDLVTIQKISEDESPDSEAIPLIILNIKTCQLLRRIFNAIQTSNLLKKQL